MTTAVKILATIGLVVVLHWGATVAIPLTLGFFLFALLEPLVIWLIPRHVSRTLSACSLTMGALIASALVIWGFYGAFAGIARNIPAYSEKLKSTWSQVLERTEKWQTNVAASHAQNEDDVQKVQIVRGRTERIGHVTGFALKGLGTVFDSFVSATFIPLIALFFLIDKPHLSQCVQATLPSDFNWNYASKATKQMVRSFFIGNLIIGGLMALCLSGLYLALGLKNAVPLGLATGFLNLIPLAGPIFSLIFPVAQGLLQFQSAVPFIIIAASVLLLHAAVANLVIPRVVGRHINVNALAATVSLLFWGWIWGAIGLLLAVPLTGLIKILLESYAPTNKLGLLLAAPERKDESRG